MKKTALVVSLSCVALGSIALACGGKVEQEPTSNTGAIPTSTSSTSSSGRPGGSGSSSSSGFGSSSSSGDIEGCPRNVTLTASDLEADPGWKPPTVAPGACSDADLKQLEANFDDTSLNTYFDLRKKLSPSCAACAVSNDTDATWGPIVGDASTKGSTGFVNFGACFAHVEGDACGKALQFEQLCYDDACQGCALTSTEQQKCVGAAGQSGGMCATFRSTTASACPKIGTTATKCNGILDAVKLLCGS